MVKSCSRCHFKHLAFKCLSTASVLTFQPVCDFNVCPIIWRISHRDAVLFFQHLLQLVPSSKLAWAALDAGDRSLYFGDPNFGVNLPSLLRIAVLLRTSGPAAWEPCAFVPFVSAQFAGEDPVVALEAALQFEDTRESMHAFCVGQYLEVRPCAVCTRVWRWPSVCHQDK